MVVGVATRTQLWDKMMGNIAEVRSRGATVVLVANDGDDDTAAQADDVLWVPATDALPGPGGRRRPLAALRLQPGPPPRTRRGPAPQPRQDRHRRVNAAPGGRGMGGVSGIGVDAVDLPRFRRVLTRRPTIVERVFTDAELAYAESNSDRAPPPGRPLRRQGGGHEDPGRGHRRRGLAGDGGDPRRIRCTRPGPVGSGGGARRVGVWCAGTCRCRTPTNVAIASVMAEGASGDAGAGAP